MGAVAEAEQAVVRAHGRVPAAFDRRRAERRFAPRRALLEAARGDDDVVGLDRERRQRRRSAHRRTSPRMQLTLLPPIQSRPSSRDTCTRPARPSFAPCAAT